MDPSGVLAGLLLIVSFAMSHSVVQIEETDWREPVLNWICIALQTGMRKSTLCKYLKDILREAKKHCANDKDNASWLCDDQSFEKMGDLMAHNHWKLIGLYDELPVFLSQVNISKGRDSRDVSIFLQLYGAEQWVRRTGKYYFLYQTNL